MLRILQTAVLAFRSLFHLAQPHMLARSISDTHTARDPFIYESMHQLSHRPAARTASRRSIPTNANLTDHDICRLCPQMIALAPDLTAPTCQYNGAALLPLQVSGVESLIGGRYRL